MSSSYTMGSRGFGTIPRVCMIDRHKSQEHGRLPQLSTVTGASGCPGGGTRRPQGGRRPIEPATRRGARTPRSLPSLPRPTSSNRPSCYRPSVRTDVTQADNLGIPSTSVPHSRLNRSTAGSSIMASTPAPRVARTCSPRSPSRREWFSRSTSVSSTNSCGRSRRTVPCSTSGRRLSCRRPTRCSDS